MSGSTGVRRGIVLGGGGLTGAAWMVGALCALERAYGFGATDANLVVGTSAGSVIAALLAAGVSPTDMAAHQRGAALPGGPLADVTYDYGVLGQKPPRPALRFGSPMLLRAMMRRPRAYAMPTWVAALTPRGRGAMGDLPALLDRLLPTWPTGPGAMELAICAMDLDTGRRMVFRRGSTPATEPARAVEASCAIPGWFAPLELDGHSYVDGGSYSFTSVDVAAGHGLDELYVLAPLAHLVRVDGRPAVGERLLRWWRLPQTRRLYDEAAVVESDGTAVRVFAPNAEELRLLGTNPMDDSRRIPVLESAMRLRCGPSGSSYA